MTLSFLESLLPPHALEANRKEPLATGFAAWLDRNFGLTSLLAEAKKFAPFPGGLRLVATPANSINILGRISLHSGEIPVGLIQDWVGGFVVSLVAAETPFLLEPIAAETAVCAFVREIGVHIGNHGLPGELLDFAAGGKLARPEFNPIEPSTIFVTRTAIEAALAATRAAVEGGATRQAPLSAIPDAMHMGEPVYDIRVRPEVLENAIKLSGADDADVKPLLAECESIGGGKYFILVDGVPMKNGWMTWRTAPQSEGIVQTYVDKTRTPVTPAPLFLAASGPPARTRLN